jgi:hypothetical protein
LVLAIDWLSLTLSSLFDSNFPPNAGAGLVKHLIDVAFHEPQDA